MKPSLMGTCVCLILCHPSVVVCPYSFDGHFRYKTILFDPFTEKYTASTTFNSLWNSQRKFRKWQFKYIILLFIIPSWGTLCKQSEYGRPHINYVITFGLRIEVIIEWLGGSYHRILGPFTCRGPLSFSNNIACLGRLFLSSS